MSGNNMTKRASPTTARLLRKLKAAREIDDLASEFPQKILPVEPLGRGMPTLAAGKLQKFTPMLRERFQFCGDWKNAFPGMTLLGLQAMDRAVRNRKVQKQIATRRDYWEGSAPATIPLDRLSLLAVDLEDGSEMYLVWSSKQEPSIVWYASQHDHTFRNLNGLLKYLIGN